MSELNWKEGDWAVYGRDIVQIKKISDEGWCEISDGMFATSGRLFEGLRPLTLRNKRAAEWFEWHYDELRKVRGEGGFNWPDINRHFDWLTLRAIDGPETDQAPYDEARAFIQEARDYKPVIQGVHLFRAA